MIKNSFINYILLTFTLSLSINGNAESKDESGMPERWGALSDSRIINSDCPDLNGRYANLGDLYELMNDLATSESQNGYAKANASSNLMFNKKPYSKNTIDSSHEPSIVIVQDKSTITIFKPSWESPRVIEQYQFSIEKKEYECDQGWLNFKLDYSTVGAESSHVNFKEKLKLTKLKNGSLLSYVHQIIQNSSIWTLGLGDSHKREVFAKYQHMESK